MACLPGARTIVVMFTDDLRDLSQSGLYELRYLGGINRRILVGVGGVVTFSLSLDETPVSAGCQRGGEVKRQTLNTGSNHPR